MSYYLKLNLPANPLKVDLSEVTEQVINGGYNLTRPEKVIKDEILDTLAQLKLKPLYVVFFGRNDQDSSLEDRLIHTDIRLGADGWWKKIIFGLNWEIENSTNEFSWWDMTGLTEIYPFEEQPEGFSKYKILNGIHFIERAKFGIPEGATQLDSTMIDGATLVRTNVPHLTVYKSNAYKRLGISIRFDERDFRSWDDVVERFRPLAISQASTNAEMA